MPTRLSSRRAGRRRGLPRRRRPPRAARHPRRPAGAAVRPIRRQRAVRGAVRVGHLRPAGARVAAVGAGALPLHRLRRRVRAPPGHAARRPGVQAAHDHLAPQPGRPAQLRAAPGGGRAPVVAARLLLWPRRPAVVQAAALAARDAHRPAGHRAPLPAPLHQARGVAVGGRQLPAGAAGHLGAHAALHGHRHHPDRGADPLPQGALLCGHNPGHGAPPQRVERRRPLRARACSVHAPACAGVHTLPPSTHHAPSASSSSSCSPPRSATAMLWPPPSWAAPVCWS